MATSPPAPSTTIDRQKTVPFHLKLFYRQSSFHPLTDFPVHAYTSHQNSDPSSLPPLRLPPHLQIYTWQSCTLRELSNLLLGALPSLLPQPSAGTRLAFRLVYPDARSIAAGEVEEGGRARYLSKELGSVIIGPEESDADEHNGHGNGYSRDSKRRRRSDSAEEESKMKGKKNTGLNITGPEAEKTLADARFIIGDYIDCAVFPPLSDGSVAPLNISGSAIQGSRDRGVGGGMRAFGPPPGAGNGYGGGRRGGRGGYGGGFGASERGAMPSGEWRRGERLPDGGYGGGGRGGGDWGRRPSRGGRGGW